MTNKTYTEIEKDLKSLLSYWEKELQNVEFIVGISRGGLFPAMVVSTTLIKPLVAAYINKEDQVFFDRNDWIVGKNVLIVDDIVRTGKTIGKIKQLILVRGAASVRTLTPYYLKKAKTCDMQMEPTYGTEIEEDILFPWDEAKVDETNELN